MGESVRYTCRARRTVAERLSGIAGGLLPTQVDRLPSRRFTNHGRDRVRLPSSNRHSQLELRTKALTARAISEDDILRMVKRRFRSVGLPAERLCNHSFRATMITDLFEQDVPCENVQRLAGQSDVRTTLFYDQRERKITRNVVERISIN